MRVCDHELTREELVLLLAGAAVDIMRLQTELARALENPPKISVQESVQLEIAVRRMMRRNPAKKTYRKTSKTGRVYNQYLPGTRTQAATK